VEAASVSCTEGRQFDPGPVLKYFFSWAFPKTFEVETGVLRQLWDAQIRETFVEWFKQRNDQNINYNLPKVTVAPGLEIPQLASLSKAGIPYKHYVKKVYHMDQSLYANVCKHCFVKGVFLEDDDRVRD
jgi:hypothetical protein